MVKIAAAKIAQYVSSPDKDKPYILIYGQDSGLISETLKSLKNKFVGENPDPFCLSNLSYKQISDDPALLDDEIKSIPFGGGVKFIVIEDLKSQFTKELQEVVKINKSENILVFIAGELAPSSSLRKFFEGLENGVALPCYHDDKVSVAKLVRVWLTEKNIGAENGVVEYLANIFSGDRLLIKSNLEKLSLYIGDNEKILLSDVENCFENMTGEMQIDELATALIQRKTEMASKIIKDHFENGLSGIILVRSLIRYLQRAYLVYLDIEDGLLARDAIAKLRPPVFFKQLPNFQKNISLLNRAKVIRMMESLIDLEKKTKSGILSDELLCSLTFIK